jgi:hypothetical protein
MCRLVSRRRCGRRDGNICSDSSDSSSVNDGNGASAPSADANAFTLLVTIAIVIGMVNNVIAIAR